MTHTLSLYHNAFVDCMDTLAFIIMKEGIPSFIILNGNGNGKGIG